MMTPGIVTRRNSAMEQDELRQRASIILVAASPSPARPLPSRAYTVAASSPSTVNVLDENVKPVIVQEEIVVPRSRGNSTNRAMTPSDYRHIGTHELGSLRITNGNTSPANAQSRKAADVLSEEKIEELEYDYLSELSDEEEIIYRRRFDPTTGGFVKYKESRLSMKPPATDGMASESEDELEPITESEDNFDRAVEPQIAELYGCAPEVEVLPIDAMPTLDTSHAIGSIHLKFSNHSPTLSRDLAQEYQSHLHSSPFSFKDSEPPSPQLEPTSKHTADDDHLFEDEVSVRGSVLLAAPPASVQGFTEARPNALDTSLPIQDAECAGNNVQPLAKADSGYSSTTSLRLSKTFTTDDAVLLTQRRKQIAVEANTQQAQLSRVSCSNDEDVIVLKRNHKSLDKAAEASHREWSSAQITQNPLRQHPPDLKRSISKGPSEAPQPENRSADAYAHRFEAVQKKVEAAFQGVDLDLPAFSQLPKPDDGTLSTVFTSSKKLSRKSLPSVPKTKSVGHNDLLKSSKSQKLHKAKSPNDRSLDITIRELHSSSPESVENVPPVSAEAAALLQNRVAAFPPLSKTFKTVHKVDSNDTLATIPRYLAIKRTSQSGMPNVPTAPETAAITPDQISLPSHQSNRESIQRKSIPVRSLTRSKSAKSTKPMKTAEEIKAKQDKAEKRKSWLEEKNDDAFVTHITSFNIVSHSLGASPYERAMSAMNGVRATSAEFVRAPSNTIYARTDGTASKSQPLDRQPMGEQNDDKTRSTPSTAARPSQSARPGTSAGLPGQFQSHHLGPQQLNSSEQTQHCRTSNGRPQFNSTIGQYLSQSQVKPMLQAQVHDLAIRKTRTPPPVSMSTRGLAQPPTMSKPRSPLGDCRQILPSQQPAGHPRGRYAHQSRHNPGRGDGFDRGIRAATWDYGYAVGSRQWDAGYDTTEYHGVHPKAFHGESIATEIDVNGSASRNINGNGNSHHDYTESNQAAREKAEIDNFLKGYAAHPTSHHERQYKPQHHSAMYASQQTQHPHHSHNLDQYQIPPRQQQHRDLNHVLPIPQRSPYRRSTHESYSYHGEQHASRRDFDVLNGEGKRRRSGNDATGSLYDGSEWGVEQC